MYKLLFTLPIWLFAMLPQNNWELFTSETGRFQILVPGVMEEKINTLETAIGTLEYHTFLHQTESKEADNLVYMISYCDYPEGTIHSDSTALLGAFFDVTVETAVKSVKGELFYASDMDWKGYPGKIWRVNYNKDTAIIKTKAYVIGSRYYSIQTITLREKSLNTKADEFLDSFEPILPTTPEE